MKKLLFILFSLTLCITIVHAQKTITLKNHLGKPYEQYQVDANGTKHGFYKKFFKNGFLETDAVYYKGKEVSSKTYEYYGATRYLMHDITWDRNGKILTAKHRTYINGVVSPLNQSAGLLANGKGRWELDTYSNEYIEYYNGNDTAYLWKDKTKTGAVNKYFKGDRVYSTVQLAIDEQLQQAWLCVQEHTYSTNNNNSTKDYYNAIEKYYNGQVNNFYVDIAKILANSTNENLRTRIKSLMCIKDIDFSKSPLEILVTEDGYLSVSSGISSYDLFKYVTNQSKLELILEIHK